MFKHFLSVLIILLSLQANAQNNFTYSPENPKPGDLITIVYEPGSDLMGVLEIPEAVAYQQGARSIATTITLRRSNRKLTASVQTDTSANMVYFSFSVDKKFDNNKSNGYWILLTTNGKIKKGSYATLAQLYQGWYSDETGVTANLPFAIEALEKEMELYPESKSDNILSYLNIIKKEKPTEFQGLVQKEIEAQVRSGLKAEADYALLESFYKAAKLHEQAKWIATMKKEKFPNGKWVTTEATNKFYAERDPAKRESLFREMVSNIATKPEWKFLEKDLDMLEQYTIAPYINRNKWEAAKRMLEATKITDKKILAFLYNYLSSKMLNDSTADLSYLATLSQKAIAIADVYRKAPDSEKPAEQTLKAWRKSSSEMYASYADTYASILYKLGNYKTGLKYANEAAIIISKGEDVNYNTTYTQLAAKAMSAQKLKSTLEQFIINGKSNDQIKTLLKTIYTKTKKSEAGYDSYIVALEKKSFLKMVEELKKSMLNETAPSFALTNLQGKTTDISELKGKVVVVDFWATWCGPCIASFPAMKKAQEKYKDNEHVKFIFINTWENVMDKKKNAEDFIAKNAYPFDVWLDAEDKVVSQFKVDGIPTKFVIDPSGIIKFKEVGFDGTEEQNVQHISAMIDLAAEASAKKTM